MVGAERLVAVVLESRDASSVTVSKVDASMGRKWQGKRRVRNESGAGATEGVNCALFLNE